MTPLLHGLRSSQLRNLAVQAKSKVPQGAELISKHHICGAAEAVAFENCEKLWDTATAKLLYACAGTPLNSRTIDPTNAFASPNSINVLSR